MDEQMSAEHWGKDTDRKVGSTWAKKPTTPAGRRIHHKATEAQPPDPQPIRETNIPTKIQVTRAPSKP